MSSLNFKCICRSIRSAHIPLLNQMHRTFNYIYMLRKQSTLTKHADFATIFLIYIARLDFLVSLIFNEFLCYLKIDRYEGIFANAGSL